MNGLEGKVFVIAGGASGIGAATAKRLGREGARVLVGDLNVNGAEATAHEIEASGGTALPFRFDISDEADCERLIRAAVDQWGSVSGLYNVAADLSQETLGRDGDAVTLSTDVLRRTLSVNLMGFFFTSRYAIPAILAAGGGSIVHTTSGVVLGLPKFAAYGAAKGGVIALSRHIAARWGKENIRSNAIDPGVTLTENQREMVTDEERAGMMMAVRAPRFGEPDEIAAMVAFLLSDEARWINGQVYPVSSMDGAR
jgi:NAD(P)-dependent dehydrogenase (short-subunit alcohol dehydrogenase family)